MTQSIQTSLTPLTKPNNIVFNYEDGALSTAQWVSNFITSFQNWDNGIHQNDQPVFINWKLYEVKVVDHFLPDLNHYRTLLKIVNSHSRILRVRNNDPTVSIHSKDPYYPFSSFFNYLCKEGTIQTKMDSQLTNERVLYVSDAAINHLENHIDELENNERENKRSLNIKSNCALL